MFKIRCLNGRTIKVPSSYILAVWQMAQRLEITIRWNYYTPEEEGRYLYHVEHYAIFTSRPICETGTVMIRSMQWKGLTKWAVGVRVGS